MTPAERAELWYDLGYRFRILLKKSMTIMGVLHRCFGKSASITNKYYKIDNCLRDLRNNLDNCINNDYYNEGVLNNVEVNGQVIDPRDVFYGDVIYIDEESPEIQLPRIETSESSLFKKRYSKKLHESRRDYIITFFENYIELITLLQTHPLIKNKKNNEYCTKIEKTNIKVLKYIPAFEELLTPLSNSA